MLGGIVKKVLGLGVLVALLGCSVTLAGAGNGIRFAYEREFPEDAIPIGDIMSSDLQPALNEITKRSNAGVPEIMLRINSQGGGVRTGFDLIQAVEELIKRNGTRVICVVDTEAYSMAFALLQSDACQVRYMTKRSALMGHNPWTRTQGDGKGLEEEAAVLRVVAIQLAEVCAARLNMTVEEYQKKIEGTTWYMAHVEAKRVGAIDDVIDPMDIPKLAVLAPPTPSIVWPF